MARQVAVAAKGREKSDTFEPRPLPQTRKGKLRRDKLKRVTAKLLRDLSYHDLTLEKITKAADIPLSVFYHYFNSKKELVLELIDEVFVEFQETVAQAGPHGTWERGTYKAQLAILNLYTANTGLMRCLYEVEDPDFSKKWRQLVGAWQTRLADGLRREFAAPGADDPDELFAVANALDGMTLEFAYQLVVLRNERLCRAFPDLESAADFLNALWMRALFLKHPARLSDKFTTLQALHDYDTQAGKLASPPQTAPNRTRVKPKK